MSPGKKRSNKKIGYTKNDPKIILSVQIGKKSENRGKIPK